MGQSLTPNDMIVGSSSTLRYELFSFACSDNTKYNVDSPSQNTMSPNLEESGGRSDLTLDFFAYTAKYVMQPKT